MPTYLYLCDKCGEMDVKQSIHDDTLLYCPKCGLGGIVKKFRPAPVSFKGSGFYSTDTKKG